MALIIISNESNCCCSVYRGRKDEVCQVLAQHEFNRLRFLSSQVGVNRGGYWSGDQAVPVAAPERQLQEINCDTVLVAN